MKRYRFRIDTPWGRAGNSCIQFMHGPVYLRDLSVEPEHYPELFEEIPDKGLEKIVKCLEDFPKQESAKDWYKAIGAVLLKAGLDPEKLETK